MARVGGAQCQRLPKKDKCSVREALADMDDLSSQDRKKLKKNQLMENPKTLSVRRLKCVYRHLTRLI